MPPPRNNPLPASQVQQSPPPRDDGKAPAPNTSTKVESKTDGKPADSNKAAKGNKDKSD